MDEGAFQGGGLPAGTRQGECPKTPERKRQHAGDTGGLQARGGRLAAGEPFPGSGNGPGAAGKDG